MYFSLWFSLCVLGLYKEAVSVPIKITIKLEEEPERPVTNLGCPGCVKTKEDIKQLRIEQVKRTMLDKLHLEESPSVQRPAVLPEPLQTKYGGLFSQDVDQGEENEQYYAETKEVISFADSVEHCDQSNHSVCFRVRIKHQYSLDEITSAKLFIKNSNPGHTRRLYYITKQKSKPNLVKVIANTDESWIPIDIKSKISNQIEKSSVSTVVFKLGCLGCADLLPMLQSELPFVELHFKETAERSRRSVEQCTDDSTYCCKESLYVSFKDIGWGNWILSPPGYWANYCRGICEGHFDILAQMTAGKRNTCCSPTRHSKLSITYLNDDGYIIQKDLPNMSVESCGCA